MTSHPTIMDTRDQYNKAKTKMTLERTNLIAASIIASEDFPDASSLPRFFPTPFNNFGHYYLLDYARLLKILWFSIEEFRDKIKDWHIYIPSILAVFVFLVSFIILQNTLYVSIEIIIIPVSAISIVVFIVTRRVIKARFMREYADIRADLIKRLAKNEHLLPDKELPSLFEFNISLIGSGDINGQRVPIVINFEEDDPFPGFGKLQMNQLYQCSPKEKKEGKKISQVELYEHVIGEIIRDFKSSAIRNYTSGYIVSASANSLSIKSDLLTEGKTPHLYCHPNIIRNQFDHEFNASLRVYFVVQVLVPEYQTAVSFFVRVYKAHHSAACQICLCTLGPPYPKAEYLEKRLLKYQSERKGQRGGDFYWFPSFQKQNRLTINFKKLKLFWELCYQRSLLRDNSKFLRGINLRDIRKIDLLSLKSLQNRNYGRVHQEIIEGTAVWPGQIYSPQNYEDMRCSSFTTDFFGRPESIGVAKSLYAQLSRSVLDSFENMDFDIGEYKDSRGHYNINAEEIGQIVVGERISIKHNEVPTNKLKKNIGKKDKKNKKGS